MTWKKNVDVNSSFWQMKMPLPREVGNFSYSKILDWVGKSARMPFQPLFLALVEALERANFESIKQLISEEKLCA